MNELRLIIFDCDGTLVDSQHQIATAMAEAFGEHGMAAPSHDSVRGVIGLSLEEAMARLCPDELEERHLALSAAYRACFLRLRQTGEIEDPLFPAVAETLQALAGAGYVMGIATGKNRRGLDHVLAKHGIADHFVTLQTPDVAPGKPHPGMMENAMRDTGARPENTLLIGDTVFDIEMARNAGTHALGVTWGYHAPETLVAAGAHGLIDHFDELVPWLGALWSPAA